MKSIYLINKIFVMVAFLAIISCNNEDISKITAIKLESIGGTDLLINQEFKFEVIANNSDTITNQAVIRIDGTEIQNATFTTATPGEYKVQAFYDGFESDLIDISAVYPSGYINNVLVEDYTGTWCTNCPRLIYAIEQAKLQTDKVISVGIHGYDPMEMDGVAVLNSEFNSEGTYPKGMLNRINIWDNPDQTIETAVNLTGYGADLGLAISSTTDGTTIDFVVKVGFENTITADLKLVVYLTENGLLYDQNNETDYYGGDNPLVDFEHNDVLRAMYTYYLGDDIPTTETIADNIYEYTLHKNIPATIQDNGQLHLIAFVTDANSKEVLNVREVKVGENQELEKL
jgi:hypothetical protein